MAVLATRDIINSLTRKGFVAREGDHTYLVLYNNDKKTKVFTKVSHGSREIDDGLIKKMQKQTHLNKNQFLDLVNCPLSKEKYIEILQRDGVIE